jgi:hypothetical protein
MEGRKDVVGKEIDDGVRDLKIKLLDRLEEKGFHEWKSVHEILGVITEEYHELCEAVRHPIVEDTLPVSSDAGNILNSVNPDKPRKYRAFEKELLDLAVAAIYGYINSKNGHIDW